MQPSSVPYQYGAPICNPSALSNQVLSTNTATKQFSQIGTKEPIVNGEHVSEASQLSATGKLNESLSKYPNSSMYQNYNQNIPTMDAAQKTNSIYGPTSIGNNQQTFSSTSAQKSPLNSIQYAALNGGYQANSAFTPVSYDYKQPECYTSQPPNMIPTNNIPHIQKSTQNSVPSNLQNQPSLSKVSGTSLIQSSMLTNHIGQSSASTQPIVNNVSQSSSSFKENSSNYGNSSNQSPLSVNNTIQPPSSVSSLTQYSIANSNIMQASSYKFGTQTPSLSSNNLNPTLTSSNNAVHPIVPDSNSQPPPSITNAIQTSQTTSRFGEPSMSSSNITQPSVPAISSHSALPNESFLPTATVTSYSNINSSILQPSTTSNNVIQPSPFSSSLTATAPYANLIQTSASNIQPPVQQPSLLTNTMQPHLSKPPLPNSVSSISGNAGQPLSSAQPPLLTNNAFPSQQTARLNGPSSLQYSKKHPNAFTQSQHTLPSNTVRPPPLSSSQFQPPLANTIPQSPANNSQYTPSNNFQVPPGAYNNHQMPPKIQSNPSHGNYSNTNYLAQPNSQSFHQSLNSQFGSLSVNQGLNKMWGYEPHDLLNLSNVLPSTKVEPPPIRLPQGISESMNCSPDLFRCTLTKIPETKSLLDKSRLPLGLLIHPFKDINQLKVIKSVIVRCKTCRTYINPFVQFVDSKIWKCNICFRSNEVHEQFLYDRNTEMYGDPYRRPEIQSATVEYLATADYNVRDPPQPAMYLFLLDVSQIAAQSRYLYTVCEVLLNNLKSLPGDLRTSVGVITYDSSIHFYSLSEGQTQPSQMILTDIDDIFLPSPDNILVNLNECYDMVVELLKQLPGKFKDSLDSGSALGAALQAAYQLLKRTGGRITVFQTCLPNMGPGALQSRENPNQRSNDEPPHMNPATDFYKKMSLDCSLSQIAVDLFILNSQYLDLATLSGISKFSSGCIHHIPLYSGKNMSHVYQLDRMFSRYLTRKIGFESVMRVRCTRGLAIHTFHGNFFVRSPDLLALPNVNPDAGFGIQIVIEENLSHIQYACFQAALLYTSSKGDRRIRVHTVCIPVVSNINDVLMGADVQCITGLLAKMAVDRSLQHSLSDAREAFLNVVCDVLSTYKLTQTGHLTGSLLAPSSLKLLPLYVLALLKHPAFRIGQSTRLDDRLFAMSEMKCQPLSSLLLNIYPELYPIHTLDQDSTFEWNDIQVPSPPILQLSAERLQASGTYLLNTADCIIILVRHGTSPKVCSELFGFHQVSLMPETLFELPQLETPLSEKLHAFISYLNDDKAYMSPIKIMKDSSPDRIEFYDRLIEDKNGAGMSYYEFLQRVREQTK